MIKIKQMKSEYYYMSYDNKKWIIELRQYQNEFDDILECWLQLKDNSFMSFTCGILINNLDEKEIEKEKEELFDNLFIQDYFTLYLEELEKLEA